MKQNEITVGRFLRIVLFAIVVVAAYFVLNSLSSVLLPFAIAWLLAYMLNPLVNFVQNKMRVKYRALSIVISMLLVVAVLYGLFMLVVPSMFGELYALKDITVSFLGKNINDGSIPEPIMNFFKEISAQYGFAEILQNSGDTGLFSMLLDRLQMLLLGTVDILGQVLTVSLIMLYLFFMLVVKFKLKSIYFITPGILILILMSLAFHSTIADIINRFSTSVFCMYCDKSISSGFSTSKPDK